MLTARSIMVTATTYTFGYVIEKQSAPTEAEIAQFDLEAFLSLYPYMAKALGDHAHDPQTQDEDYLIGLRYIIQGSVPEQ